MYWECEVDDGDNSDGEGKSDGDRHDGNGGHDGDANDGGVNDGDANDDDNSDCGDISDGDDGNTSVMLEKMRIRRKTRCLVNEVCDFHANCVPRKEVSGYQEN